VGGDFVAKDHTPPRSLGRGRARLVLIILFNQGQFERKGVYTPLEAGGFGGFSVDVKPIVGQFSARIEAIKSMSIPYLANA
jgi:hypothetical protein